MAEKLTRVGLFVVVALWSVTPSPAADTEATMVWKADLEDLGATVTPLPGKWRAGACRAVADDESDWMEALRGEFHVGDYMVTNDAYVPGAALGQAVLRRELRGFIFSTEADHTYKTEARVEDTAGTGNAETELAHTSPIAWPGLIAVRVKLEKGAIFAGLDDFAAATFTLSIAPLVDPLVDIKLTDGPDNLGSVEATVSTDPAASFFNPEDGTPMTVAEMEAHLETILDGVFLGGIDEITELFRATYALPDPLPSGVRVNLEVEAAAKVITAPRYVDGDLGDDANPGTFDQPLATIGAAVEQAVPHDTIIVYPGYYTENIAPTDSVHVFSWDHLNTGDSQTAIVDGSLNTAPVFDLQPDSTIQGLRVQWGSHGVRTSGNSWLSGNGMWSNNATGENGGGIDYRADTCTNGDTVAVITHNEIRQNGSGFDLTAGGGGFGAGVAAELDADATCGSAAFELRDNTFRDNSAAGTTGIPGLGGGLYLVMGALPGASAVADVHANSFIQNAVGTWAEGLGGNVFIGSQSGGDNTINFVANVVGLGQAQQAAGMLVAATVENDAVFTANVTGNSFGGNSATLDTGGFGAAIEAIDLTGLVNLSFGENTVENNFADTEAGAHFKFNLTRTPSGNFNVTLDGNLLKTNMPTTGVANLKIDLSGNSDDGAGGSVPTGADVWITNNMMRGDRFTPTGPGTELSGTATGDTAFNYFVRLNTIIEQTDDHAVLYNWVTESDSLGNDGRFSLENNSNIYADSGTGIGGTAGGTGTSTVTHLWNLWFSNTQNVDPAETDPVGLNGNFEADPQFDWDYTLLPGSPAIDAADPALMTTMQDFFGKERPFDGNADSLIRNDVGACEHWECVDSDGDGYGDGATGAACPNRANDCNDGDADTWDTGGETWIVMLKDPATGEYTVHVTSVTAGSTDPVYYVETSSAADAWMSSGSGTPGCADATVTGNTFVDTVSPGIGEVLYYQVGESSSCGHGPLGHDRDSSACYP